MGFAAQARERKALFGFGQFQHFGRANLIAIGPKQANGNRDDLRQLFILSRRRVGALFQRKGV